MIILSEKDIKIIEDDASHRVDIALANTVFRLLSYVKTLQEHSEKLEAKLKEIPLY